MPLKPRPVAAGLAAVAYVVASQWLMTRDPPSPWSAVALLTPMLAVVAVGAWRSGQRLIAALSAFALATLVGWTLHGEGLSAERLYLAEHFGIHVFLGVSFGVTLRPGERPLIARLADRVHDGLTPAMERYTRKVTLAWTLYFFAMATLSLVLFMLLPFAAWATFANLATPIALICMFVGEYLLRYRLHPEFERATLHDMVRAWGHARRERGTPAAPADSIR